MSVSWAKADGSNMTFHNTEFPKIGETTEHAAPALHRSLGSGPIDLVDVA